jgi:FixJ family two-component response regulator
MYTNVRTIAIIDDDDALRQALGRVLRARGFRTVEFDSAEALLGSPDGLGADCLLLDIDLPGMSGLELCSHFLLWPEPPPVVFITGREGGDTARTAWALEAQDHLAKPVEAQVLLEAIERALIAPRRAGALAMSIN